MSLTLLFDIVIIGNILSFLIFFWLNRTSSKFFGQFFLNVCILTMKIFFSFCWRLLFCVGSSVTRLNYFHQLVAISHHIMSPHLLLHNLSRMRIVITSSHHILWSLWSLEINLWCWHNVAENKILHCICYFSIFIFKWLIDDITLFWTW